MNAVTTRRMPCYTGIHAHTPRQNRFTIKSSELDTLTLFSASERGHRFHDIKNIKVPDLDFCEQKNMHGENCEILGWKKYVHRNDVQKYEHCWL